MYGSKEPHPALRASPGSPPSAFQQAATVRRSLPHLPAMSLESGFMPASSYMLGSPIMFPSTARIPSAGMFASQRKREPRTSFVESLKVRWSKRRICVGATLFTVALTSSCSPRSSTGAPSRWRRRSRTRSPTWHSRASTAAGYARTTCRSARTARADAAPRSSRRRSTGRVGRRRIVARLRRPWNGPYITFRDAIMTDTATTGENALQHATYPVSKMDTKHAPARSPNTMGRHCESHRRTREAKNRAQLAPPFPHSKPPYKKCDIE